MKRDKILIFGAGLGGKNAYKALSKYADVLAFIDNDNKKLGRKIAKKVIVGANDINKYQYDTIWIASQYAREIRKQLLILGIAEDKIENVNPYTLAGAYPKVQWKCALIVAMATSSIIASVYLLINMSK